MKTSLKYILLVLAVSLPTVVTAESLGFTIPLALDPATLFGALISTFVVLTFVSDYTRRPRLVLPQSVAVAAADKAHHPLAA